MSHKYRVIITIVSLLSVLLLVAAVTQVDWFTQIRNRPTVPLNPTDYNFTAISPTSPSALTAATPATVTIPLDPRGLVGNDANDHVGYRVHVGPDNPENVLITGGTCPGDGKALNCTLAFTPANNHVAGYQITSATAGWNEAIRALPRDAGNANALTGTVKATAASSIGAAISIPTGGCAVVLDGGGNIVTTTSTTDDVIRVELANFVAANCGYSVNIHDFILNGGTTSGAALKCNFCGGGGSRNSVIANIQVQGSPNTCFWVNGTGTGNGTTFSNLQANGCTNYGIYDTISQVNMGGGLVNVAQGGNWNHIVIATAAGATSAWEITAEAAACTVSCASASTTIGSDINLNGGQYGLRVHAIANAALGEITLGDGYYQGTTGAGVRLVGDAGANSIGNIRFNGCGYMYSTSGYGFYADGTVDDLIVTACTVYVGATSAVPSMLLAGTKRAKIANSWIAGRTVAGAVPAGIALELSQDPNTSSPTQTIMISDNYIGEDPLYPSSYHIRADQGLVIDSNNHTEVQVVGNSIFGATAAVADSCATCSQNTYRNNNINTTSGSAGKPTCSAKIRGSTWYTPSGAGVKDLYEVCRKDAADAYAWQSAIP